jgi:hypothetical protein
MLGKEVVGLVKWRKMRRKMRRGRRGRWRRRRRRRRRTQRRWVRRGRQGDGLRGGGILEKSWAEDVAWKVDRGRWRTIWRWRLGGG